MKTFYMIRRKCDGQYHTGNHWATTGVGKTYTTKGAAKNGWNAMLACGKDGGHEWEIVECSFTEVGVIPLPAKSK